MWLLDTLPYYIKEVGMNDFFDDDFDDEDHFFDDEIDNELDDISNNVGSEDSEKSRTGLEWYEMAFLGGLADELSDEKRKRQLRRDKTDRNHFRRKA
jgi:hypothetical protein